MLARSSQLKHPSGLAVETPLLVPSFSSKGFGFKRKKGPHDGGREVSSVNQALAVATQWLNEPILISAYDLHHKHITGTRLSSFPLVFVDSGGYETATHHDLSAVYQYPYEGKEWNEDLLSGVYDSWSRKIPAVFVSFDHPGKRMAKQVESAGRLFGKYPEHLHAMILKPERKRDSYLELSSILSNVAMFGDFDIVGLSEKELGDSLLKRMTNIARLRLAFNEARLNTPIQIFGSLDPLTTPLYFTAGAEIFDGLTWLRYSYYEGVAVYLHNYGAISLGVDESDSLVSDMSLVNNVIFLRSLRRQMRSFARTHDFSIFDHNTNVLRKAYEELKTAMGGRI